MMIFQVQSWYSKCTHNIPGGIARVEPPVPSIFPDFLVRTCLETSNFASKCNDFTIFRLFRSFYRFDLFAFSIRFTVSIFLPFRSLPFRSILPFRSFPKDRKGKKDRNGKKIETVKDRNGKKDRIFTDSNSQNRTYLKDHSSGIIV